MTTYTVRGSSSRNVTVRQERCRWSELSGFVLALATAIWVLANVFGGLHSAPHSARAPVADASVVR